MLFRKKIPTYLLLNGPPCCLPIQAQARQPTENETEKKKKAAQIITDRSLTLLGLLQRLWFTEFNSFITAFLRIRYSYSICFSFTLFQYQICVFLVKPKVFIIFPKDKIFVLSSERWKWGKFGSLEMTLLGFMILGIIISSSILFPWSW